MKKHEIGVIHGRFQMLHKGHMEYLLEAKKRCDYLIIGICNPEYKLTKFDAACPHRSEESSNPLSYYERMEMIKGALLDEGVDRNEFDIVPFPINFPETIFNYAPSDAVYFITIYDEWGERKKELLEKLGCSVEVMWRRTDAERFTSGTEVRKRIAMGEDWKKLVPQYVYNYIINHHIDERIKRVMT